MIEFGSGMGPAYQATQSVHLNSALLYAATAEAFSCESDRNEMGTAYDESFDADVIDGDIYQARAAHCAAGISIGFAAANYSMMGTSSSWLPECSGTGPFAILVPDLVQNDRRGLRLESVEVDFHHIDLEVRSVTVNDFTPLDGVIAQVIAEVHNIGVAPAYSVQVQLRDNGVPKGNWMIPLLDVGQSERFRFPWDTTGLFGSGSHTLSVYVESLTIAELEYANNTGSVTNVVVQPSLKAAFVTRGRTVGGRCNDCGAVDVFDTQSLVRIGTIDIKAATGVSDPRPRAIAVPDAGTTAWLVTELHPNRRSFGLLGIDVMSCYSGVCQRIGPPTSGPAPWPTSAQGDIAVRADGAFAFVPYNSNSLVASIAAFPLSSSGAGVPTTTVLPFTTQGLDSNSKSSVALAPSGTGREELYVVGGHAQLNYARIFRIPVSDRDFRVDPLVVERFDLHAPSGGLDRLPLAVEYSAEIQHGVGPVWGHRAVLTDARGGAFITFDTNCAGQDSTTTYGPPCALGHTSIATRPLLAELTSARDGLTTAATVPISLLGPDVFWGMNPNQPNVSPAPSGTGCAGPPGRCDGYFADLALGFPIARASNVNLVQEFWVADHGHNSGAIDIYGRGGQWQSFGIPLLTPAEAITIVPIPLSGSPWVFPPPLPWPDPLPVPWPPGARRFWNLVRVDAIERDSIDILVPAVNLGTAPIDLELELSDLPEGWQASWDPLALSDVPPFTNELENLRFVPVTLSSPGWFEEAATFGLRAFPVGSPPDEAAVIFMRVENANAVPRRDDDGTRESSVDLAEAGDIAAKVIELLGDPEHLVEARLWLHANAAAPVAKARTPDYRVQINGDPARELIFDPVVLFDGDPLTFEWVSLDVPPSWLHSGLNELLVEPTGPAPTLGISVGVDLDDDVERSWWSTAAGGCPGDPVGCAGELMILLELVFDCDGDGFLDHAELRSGLSEDIDHDGLLDRCTGAVAIRGGDSPLISPQPLIAYPNPFNPRVTLRLSLDRPSWAELIVYDLRGQRVSILWTGRLPEGESEFIWEGTDQRGEQVASGVYVVRAIAAGKEERCKLVLLR
jgi:hypothetical protein